MNYYKMAKTQLSSVYGKTDTFQDDDIVEMLRSVTSDILFHRKFNDCDLLLLLNWADDHRPCKVYSHQNRFVKLNYCGRCSNIVAEGDKYCSQCGRALKWE